MKRFHVHIRVDDLNANIQFYNQLFSQQPNIKKSDYAKWILDDPRLNFALSTHGQEKGFNHLGIEFEDKNTFDALKIKHASQQSAKCCYALSDKHWLLDPQEVPWELFHSYGEMDDYGFSDTKETIVKDNEPTEVSHCEK